MAAITTEDMIRALSEIRERYPGVLEQAMESMVCESNEPAIPCYRCGDAEMYTNPFRCYTCFRRHYMEGTLGPHVTECCLGCYKLLITPTDLVACLARHVPATVIDKALPYLECLHVTGNQQDTRCLMCMKNHA